METQQQNKTTAGKFCDLPSPPAILIALIDSCNNPDVSFESLAEIIQKDASITSQVMSAANSPFYRQWNEFTTLQQMLVVLGINSVRTIAINSAVQQYFSNLSKQIGQSLDLIWSRSLVCAYVARSLAELTAYATLEEAYLAGLLHRLGQLALLQSDHQGYLKLIDTNQEIQALLQAEEKSYGATFPLIGSEMVDRWQLEGFLSDALRFQCEPAENILDSSQLVKLVNLSCQLVANGIKPDDSALAQGDELFGLNQAVLEQVITDAHEKASAAAGSLGIPFSVTGENSSATEKSEAQQQALGERVKQAALFGGTLARTSEKADFSATLQQIQRDVDLLFGIKQVCFLLKAEDAPQLIPHCPSPTRRENIQDLVIAIEPDRSTAAWVFNNQSLAFTHDDAHLARLSVADQQLMRLISSEALLYLPLTSQEYPIGVIALGMDKHQYDALTPQISLLKLFAREAGETLQLQQELSTSRQQLLDDERAAFHLEARKVVHEANNPLGIINNYLHILGMKLGDDNQVKEELDIIKDEINRVGKILLRIRDIPDELEQQEKRVDINSLITDLHKLFQSSLFTTHNINTEVDLDANIPLITLQRGHMKQILTNLIKNAVEAMPEGGKLSIATRDNAYLNGKAHIEIQIVDSGPGIDSEIMDQLFLPGNSTKDSSHSGLGLAIIKSLMDELSGVINCTSNNKTGTRFQLFLPRTA
ncbi:MAG: HDOD domain-containing protein [Candidatus Thiodiazotropha sp. 6PLUC3]